MCETIIGTIIGVVIGGLITYLVSKHYYILASEQLQDEANKLAKQSAELLKFSKVMLIAMQAPGWKITQDTVTGEITGITYEQPVPKEGMTV